MLSQQISDKEFKRLKYRYDSEFRSRIINRMTENDRRNRKFATYRELRSVNNKICNYRQTIINYSYRIEEVELKLKKMLQRREILKAKWKEIRLNQGRKR